MRVFCYNFQKGRRKFFGKISPLHTWFFLMKMFRWLAILQLQSRGTVASGGCRYYKGASIHGWRNGDFHESEDNDKLMHFYEDENRFKRFVTKEVKANTQVGHSLI